MGKNDPAIMRPLRVLCCSGSLDGGGSERQLWQLASKLDRRQFAPSVYLLYRRGHYIEQLPSDVNVAAFWDHYDERRWFTPGEIRRTQIAHLAVLILEHQIDVVYDRTFHMTLVTAAAAARARVPRVSVIVSPPSADFQRSRERFRFFKKRILAKAYRQSGCVTIAVSEEVADDAAAFYRLDRKNIVVLPNPVDVAAVRSAANESVFLTGATSFTNQPSTNQHKGQLRIAVVGRLSGEKGQRLALEALKIANAGRVEPIKLELVGDGPDRDSLEALTTELGLREHVTFHGFLPNPYPLIRASNLVCIPSEYEGLPNVALEAMVLETGLVATNCSGSLRTLIGNNSSASVSDAIQWGERGALVAPGNAKALADVFCSLETERDAWLRRTAAAKRWVESQHAIESWLEEMSKLLSGLACKRHFKLGS